MCYCHNSEKVQHFPLDTVWFPEKNQFLIGVKMPSPRLPYAVQIDQVKRSLWVCLEYEGRQFETLQRLWDGRGAFVGFLLKSVPFVGLWDKRQRVDRSR